MIYTCSFKMPTILNGIMRIHLLNLHYQKSRELIILLTASCYKPVTAISNSIPKNRILHHVKGKLNKSSWVFQFCSLLVVYKF